MPGTPTAEDSQVNRLPLLASIRLNCKSHGRRDYLSDVGMKEGKYEMGLTVVGEIQRSVSFLEHVAGYKGPPPSRLVPISAVNTGQLRTVNGIGPDYLSGYGLPILALDARNVVSE
ncbi:hypothetical protein K449DRAFT_396682 [Hypoxylon sp. EC38]|nr:hypothetical protein K449DRAFT_396682 [Hypoxylon sp. EC38]